MNKRLWLLWSSEKRKGKNKYKRRHLFSYLHTNKFLGGGAKFFSYCKFCLLFSKNNVKNPEKRVLIKFDTKRQKISTQKSVHRPPLHPISLRSNAALQKLSKTSHVNNLLAWTDLWRNSLRVLCYSSIYLTIFSVKFYKWLCYYAFIRIETSRFFQLVRDFAIVSYERERILYTPYILMKFTK